MATNSPVNINLDDNTISACSETCDFTFKYSDSTCVVRKITLNGGFQSLLVPYESGNSSTNVKHKGTSYVPIWCAIFNSSFHTFDQEKSTGELLIAHAGSGGDGAGKILIVSIPISVTDGTMNASGKIVDTIIKAVPNDVTVANDASTTPYEVKFSGGNGLFNLSDVIPSNAPFYTYIGNFFYSTNSETINYIVFPKYMACAISADAATTLNKRLKPIAPPNTGMPVNSVSMNSIGANARKSGEIYIECNPTGHDGVILYKKSLKGDPATDSIDGVATMPGESIFESEIFLIGVYIICALLGTVLIIMVLKVVILEGVLKKSDGGSGSTTAPAAPTATAT
jgi:hypothetical protein